MSKHYKWARRSEEWIKANPGKGTMYRSDDHGNEILLNRSIPESVKQENVPDVQRGNFPNAGVYAIICENEKHAYVGQSYNMDTRMRNHKMNIINNGESANKYYYKMKAHAKKHGIDSFQFIKYKPYPHATLPEILKCESDAMAEFMENGYSLYNHALPVEIVKASVFCPKVFRESIVKLVEAIHEKRLTLPVLEQFVNSLTKL